MTNIAPVLLFNASHSKQSLLCARAIIVHGPLAHGCGCYNARTFDAEYSVGCDEVMAWDDEATESSSTWSDVKGTPRHTKQCRPNTYGHENL
jgi:hypothetical protein